MLNLLEVYASLVSSVKLSLCNSFCDDESAVESMNEFIRIAKMGHYIKEL
jgi:hypothetical protein